MNIEERKQDALDKLDDSFISAQHGTLEEHIVYLKEEFRELDLSKGWDDLENKETQQDNPNNVLLYWLMDLAPYPTVLEHNWTGGDFPDVDIDFEPEARDKIKGWLKDTYGEQNCMEVATMGGTAIKGAIQDLSRIDGIEPKEFMPVTTGIKYSQSNDEENTLEYVLANNKKAREYLDAHPTVRDDVAKMENVFRNVGTHASAFVVASVPIDSYIPIIRSPQKKTIVTGYSESSGNKALNQVGLIKFDLLGLENLTVNRQAEEMIEARYGGAVDWDTIDINDKKIYRMLNKHLTGGIFQVESSVAAMVISEIHPDCFEDLAAVNALIRPACLQVKSHVAYANHKNGKFDRANFPVWLDLKEHVSEFTYDLLDSTYGIPIYQEQTMALLAEFCEVHLDETNKMRKIIGIPPGKKKPEHLEYISDQRDIFIANAEKRIGEEQAYQWWDTAVGSLSYGFNRSHCVAYSMISFRQLFLKRYFPKEFYCSLLQMEVAQGGTQQSKLMKYIIEARALGVPVQAPHIQHSSQELGYVDDVIYMGFGQAKGIGDKAADHIVERGPYASFKEFIEVHKKGTGSKVTKTSIESLIYSHAFRDFGSVFELLEEWFVHNLPKTKKDTPWNKPEDFELLLEEQKRLSICLSKKNAIDLPYGYMSITRAIDTEKDAWVKLKGIVKKCEILKARSGNKYGKLVINDLENDATIFAWRNFLGKIHDIKVGDTIQIQATHMDSPDSFGFKKLIKINGKEQ